MIPVDYISKNLSPGGSLSAAGIFCLFGRVAPSLPYLDTTGTITALSRLINPVYNMGLEVFRCVKMRLSELSPNDKLWDFRRLQAHYLSQLYSLAGNIRYSQRLEECSNYLDFSAFPDPGSQVLGTIRLSLTSAHFCRVRLCPICQWRKSMKNLSKFLAVLPEIIESGGDKFLLLTLTVRNCPIDELRDTIQTMNQAWRRIANRSHFKKYVVGWFRSLEITRNHDTDYAHPHFHCLIQVAPSYFGRGYLKQSCWAELWQDSLRVSYTPIVDVRRVRAGGDTPLSDISSAALECLKYVSKSDDVLGPYAPGDDSDLDRRNAEWLEAYSSQIFGLRTFASGGTIKKSLQLADEYSDDELVFVNGEKLNISDRLAQILALWDSSTQFYSCEV